MKKSKIRVLMLLVSVVLAFSVFGGCSSTKKTESIDKTNAPQSTPADQEAVTVKWFINDSKPDFTDADNALKTAIEKANNVKLEFEIPPLSNYKERLQIALASGTFPDIITMTSNTDETYLSPLNNGILIPLNKYLDNAPNIKKYTYDFSWASVKKNGTDEIYGIPRTTIMRQDGFVIRQDWLDKLGITINPLEGITLDQFEDILKKFTFNDPDNNGKQDTYGFGFTANADGSFGPFVTAPFGILGWQKSNGGKYAYMNKMYDQQDGSYKKALEYCARLYKAGVIDPSTPLMKSSANLDQKFEQGVIGMKPQFAGYVNDQEERLKKIVPTAKLTYVAGIKNEQGKLAGVGYGSGMSGFYAITKTAKDPERIVKMLDWMLSDEGYKLTRYGVKDITYTEKDGVLMATDAAKNNNFTHSGYMRRKGDADYFINIAIAPELRPQMKKNLEAAINMMQPSLDAGYQPPTASSTQYIDAQKQFYATTAKIILGGATINDFDKTLENWYKAGGEQYVKEMNDYFAKTQGVK